MIPKSLQVKKLTKTNFIPTSCPGCYVALDESSDWIIESKKFDPSVFGFTMNELDKAPEISVEPEEGLLSVINTDKS